MFLKIQKLKSGFLGITSSFLEQNIFRRKKGEITRYVRFLILYPLMVYIVDRTLNKIYLLFHSYTLQNIIFNHRDLLVNKKIAHNLNTRPFVVKLHENIYLSIRMNGITSSPTGLSHIDTGGTQNRACKRTVRQNLMTREKE